MKTNPLLQFFKLEWTMASGGEFHFENIPSLDILNRDQSVK